MRTTFFNAPQPSASSYAYELYYESNIIFITYNITLEMV